MSNTRIVLPARLASTRLKDKLLQRVGGSSVLQRTYEAACQAKCAAGGVIVAVDDQRIADEVDSFGGSWIMTPTDCASGTDRIAVVARAFPDTDVFINVQGDEPEIDPAAIDAVADAIHADASADIATAGTPLRDKALLIDPNVVKIVLAEQSLDTQTHGDQPLTSDTQMNHGRAVYFSRAAVPYDRDGNLNEYLSSEPPCYWHHLGLYAYRRDFLAWFAQAPPSRLETIERLEQLRAIEAGKKIIVARVGPAMPGIDTVEDLNAFRLRVAGGSE